MEDNLNPIRKPEILLEAGGMVDETRVTLALYGDDLEPDVVSSLLGCRPSRAHRKGDRLKPTSVPFQTGAWLFTVEGRAPQGPADLIRSLLEKFGTDPAFWQSLAKRYELQMRVGIHSGGWNRGFDLPADVIASVAMVGTKIGFDLYFDGDRTDEGV